MKGKYNNSNNNGEINMFYFKFLKNNKKNNNEQITRTEVFF